MRTTFIGVLVLGTVGCQVADDGATAAQTSAADSTGDAMSASSSDDTTSPVDGTESDGNEPGDQTTSTGPDSGEPEATVCGFVPPSSAGQLAAAEIDEASGLVHSRQHDDVLWVHNDSGDEPRIFAIASDGALLTTVAVEGAEAVDWEDAALGPGPRERTDYLYVGDIGDNDSVRPFVTVYRFEEPMPDATTATATALPMAYPDGPHNAETLLSDPQTGDLFIVTKTVTGVSGIYRYPAPQRADAMVTLEAVGEIGLATRRLPGDPFAVGGDVASDGARVVIRSYTTAFVWERRPGISLADALAVDPCVLVLEPEAQGETLALSGAPGSMFTVSEGSLSPIWRYDRP